MEKFNYIIIGNSAAGVSALEAIRQFDEKGSITVISDENYPLYLRCLISYYLSGEIAEEGILFKPLDFYEEMRVKPMLGKKAVKVVPSRSEVVLEDRERLAYNRLLLATGASPEKLGIKGENSQDAHVMRTIADVKKIMSSCKTTDTAVVIGGGLVGMKATYGLNRQGLKVEVIDIANQILPQMLDLEAANILRDRLEEHGIVVRTGLFVEEMVEENGRICAVRLSNGDFVPCQMVIMAGGVNPNIELARDSGIKINRGIPTDEMMRTNIENIFAAGDVAETVDLLRGERVINALWPNAVSQGRVAGKNMAGREAKYNGSISMNSISLYDLNIISFGVVNPPENGYETIVENTPPNYRKLVVKDGEIVGMINLGDIRNSGATLSLSLKGEKLSQIGGALMGHGIFRNRKVLSIKGRQRMSNYC